VADPNLLGQSGGSSVRLRDSVRRVHLLLYQLPQEISGEFKFLHGVS
jgi:hypothetical protein